MQKLLEMANVRAEGKISYEELVMSSINKRLIAKEERLHELFVQLDLNKTGYLTANEIETVIGAQQDVSALIAEVDTQGWLLVLFP
jgi:Ca2+-binding EF-hand superfamily protein